MTEKVARSSSPYGCANRTIKRGYYVNVRVYQPDGTYKLLPKFIKHTMSEDCRYDGREEDRRCITCRHNSRPGNGELLDAYEQTDKQSYLGDFQK